MKMLVIHFFDSNMHMLLGFESSMSRRKLTVLEDTCLLPGREVSMKYFIVVIALCSLGWTLSAHLIFHPICVICIGDTTCDWILNQV